MTERKPKIRFKGFSDAWEQRKLGELLEFHNGFNGSYERYGRGIPLISVMDILCNDFITSENIRTKASLTKVEFQRFKVEYGDVLFQRSSENVNEAGTSNVYLDERKCAVFGGFVICGKKKSEYVPFFLRYGLTNKGVRAQITSKAQGAQHINVSQDTLQGIKILLPSQHEQEKIGSAFLYLDNLLTLHQRKLDKLQTIKKALLEKMFPKNGESVPEIRFKGFSDAWKQRKFSDVVATRRGLTYKPSDIRKNGIRVLRSSNIIEDSFLISDDDIFVRREAINVDYARTNDILITAANGSSRLVGKHSIINGILEKSAVHGGFMLLGTTKEPYFINASMGSLWYRRFIELFVSGGNGAIGNINKNDLDNQEIAIPSEMEQKIIGAFFQQLDHLITLHQRKLDKLQTIKKALLEKMFV